MGPMKTLLTKTPLLIRMAMLLNRTKMLSRKMMPRKTLLTKTPPTKMLSRKTPITGAATTSTGAPH